MVPTDLPSISRWKARFHPKFGTLSTIRRPGGGLSRATVLMEIAHTKARIRKTFLAKLCLGFMAHITHGTGFSPVQPAVDSACNTLEPGDCRTKQAATQAARAITRKLTVVALALLCSRAIRVRSGCDQAPA